MVLHPVLPVLRVLILALAHLGLLPLAVVVVVVEILITQQLAVLAVGARAQTDNLGKPGLLDKAMLAAMDLVAQMQGAVAAVAPVQQAHQQLAVLEQMAA